MITLLPSSAALNIANTAPVVHVRQNPARKPIETAQPRSRVALIEASRLDETDLRSSLTILARLEAAFRIDYKQRCAKKKPDPVSIEFRALSSAKGRKVALEDEIWEYGVMPILRRDRLLASYAVHSNSGIGSRTGDIGKSDENTIFRRSTSWRMQFWPPFRFMGEAPLPPLWE
jgi:hypothetical protein